MFTVGSYLDWQIQAQSAALRSSLKSEHARVRASVPHIRRELDFLHAVKAGMKNPYADYVETLVAINCAARANGNPADFWDGKWRAQRLAARQTLNRAMKWKD